MKLRREECVLEAILSTLTARRATAKFAAVETVNHALQPLETEGPTLLVGYTDAASCKRQNFRKKTFAVFAVMAAGSTIGHSCPSALRPYLVGGKPAIQYFRKHIVVVVRSRSRVHFPCNKCSFTASEL